MRKVEWFFDFISPFSYFQLEHFEILPPDVEVIFRPVLLAGLLNHWENKGPAEIPPKRQFTYRHVQWQAEKQGLSFRWPPGHPFNSLALLRLAIALGNHRTSIQTIFRYIWQQGQLPQTPETWQPLLEALNVENLEELIQQPAVKETLKQNGARAIELGVFGVPSFVVNGEVFWGADATGFFLDYLEHPEILATPEMQRLAQLPMVAQRQV